MNTSSQSAHYTIRGIECYEILAEILVLFMLIHLLSNDVHEERVENSPLFFWVLEMFDREPSITEGHLITFHKNQTQVY